MSAFSTFNRIFLPVGILTAISVTVLSRGMVAADGPIGTCLGYHRPSGDPNATALVTTIDGSKGANLKSDGKGPYYDEMSDVRTYAHGALMVLVRWSNSCASIPPYTRYVVWDLPHPLKGAVSKGKVTDHDSWIAANSEQGFNAQTMPLGARQSSYVTEFSIYINGSLHILHFGPGTYPDKPKLNGNGTTRPTMTRTSATSWTLESANESVGRLWTNVTANKPTDLGLFKFKFKVNYTAK